MATPEPRPGPTRQRPVRAERVVRALEHPSSGAVRERTRLAAHRPPQRPCDWTLEGPQVTSEPGQRFGRQRDHPPLARTLRDDRHALSCPVDVLDGGAKQLFGARTRTDVTGDQSPVPVGGHLREELIPHRIRDRPGCHLLSTLAIGTPSMSPTQLKWAAVSQGATARRRLRDRVHDRAVRPVRVEVVEPANSCQRQVDRRRTVPGAKVRLAGLEVHGGGGSRLPAALEVRRDPQPADQNCRLRLGGAVPPDAELPHDSEPQECRVAVRPDGTRTVVTDCHVSDPRAYGFDDIALFVEHDVRLVGPRTEDDSTDPRQLDLTGPQATPYGIFWGGFVHTELLAGHQSGTAPPVYQRAAPCVRAPRRWCR